MAPAEDLRQGGGDGGQHRRGEDRQGDDFREVGGGGLGEAESGGDPQVRGVVLEQDQHEGGEGDHPEQRVAVGRAGGDVGGPVAGIDEADGHEEAGADVFEDVPDAANHAGTPGRGSGRRRSSSAATPASPAPRVNAAAAPHVSQTTPKRRLAGRAPMPMAQLYQPKAAPRSSGVGDVSQERLLHPFGETVEEAVEGEEPPYLRGALRVGEPQVRPGIDQPPGDDDPLAADPVRQGAEGERCRHLDQVEEGPEQGDLRHADPGLPGLEQEKGVGGVAEGKDEEDEEIVPEPAPGDRPEEVPVGGGPGEVAAGVADLEDDKEYGQRAGDGGEPEDGAEVGGDIAEERSGNERPHQGAGMVHGTVETEGGPPQGGVNGIGDEGIPGRGPDPLPHPVEKPDREHPQGAGGNGNQGSRQGGEPVAAEDEPLPVGNPVGDDPGDAA